MCNTWGCFKFPHIVTTRPGHHSLSTEITAWLNERKLRFADMSGNGDYLMILARNDPSTNEHPYTYAFKDPEVAMLFKLTWA